MRRQGTRGRVSFGSVHPPICCLSDGPPGPTSDDHPERGDTLETLQAAVEAVEAGTATAHHLAQLVRAGSDIGGARPKATIWRDGLPLIAKFRSQGDAFDEPRVEATCLTLARACGIEVPAHEVVSIGSRSVLLVSRFDRPGNGERLGYSSAATMMGVTNTEYATNET